jgi:serine phosphatase RsbU (regulator of sigma subunit)
MKNLPSLIEAGGYLDVMVDSVNQGNFQMMDSVMTENRPSGAFFHAGDGSNVSFSYGDTNKIDSFNLDKGVDLVFIIYILIFGFLLAFNIPFRRYFNKKRKGRNISEKLSRFVKKYLLVSPVINASVLLAIILSCLIKSIFTIYNLPDNGHLELSLHYKILIISLVATLLIFIFSLFWHRHRVRFKYIDHVYTNDEIKSRLSKFFEPKVKVQLALIHAVTTLLPISVILFYIFLSLSSPSDFGIKELNADHIKILTGKYSELLSETLIERGDLSFLVSAFYINSFDAFLASVGILSSFLVALIYVILMTRWFTIQITTPLSSLLSRMESASDKKEYSHAVLRTNDEFGKLTTGYNLMSDKIRDYINEIEEMNKGLEQKVIERTQEIMNQKNEIEAQRDEIEAQRDEIEAQRDEITAQRDMVTQQKNQIEVIHEEQTSSIRYAKRIQQAMLPTLDIFKECGFEHFIFFRPRNIVSGDFYWTGKKDENIIITVADCTGHGVPGAFMSMLGITFLKECVLKDNIFSPDEILTNLRNEVIKSLRQNEDTQQKDGMDIAVCTINLKTMKMQFSGANNPLYLIRKKELIEFRADKMPVAIHERMDPFTLHSFQLEKGDLIYLFSDGYADQFGGSAERSGGKKFMYKPLKEMLLANSQKSLSEQKQVIENTLTEWRGDLDQVDDITIMGIKI